MILQNILCYDRIESSHSLDQDTVLKEKLDIKSYPDPETFRDELKKYTHDNIEELLFVNRKLLDILCTLTCPQYVDLRKKLLNVPGRLVNRSGKMLMRMIEGFLYIEVLNYVKE